MFRASPSATSPNPPPIIPSGRLTSFANPCANYSASIAAGTGLAPDGPIQLSHTLRVTSGVAGREPAQKIVDALYATQQRSGQYRGCSAYVDFRQLLEKQKDLDAVVVCTTDNILMPPSQPPP